MRRAGGLVFLFLGLLLTVGCSEEHETALVQTPVDNGEGLPSSTSSDLYDATSGAEGANPHFYFLSPIAKSTPAYDGIQDDSLEPVVTVCPFGSWNGATEECSLGQEVAVFSMDASDPDDRINLDPGTKFNVVWQTSDHPATAGETYRIAVSVVGQLLGYVDVTAFDQSEYTSHHNTAEGVIALSANGSLNITFRIEDGALESEYCDPDNLEDCDVALFTYQESGCLRVFEYPGQSAEQLGSQVCVPADAAKLGDTPVEGTYAVILTLEDQGNFQGGAFGTDQQIPYFPDLFTDPPGITFDPNSEGVSVTICQVEDPNILSEEDHENGLNFFLRPFIVWADGTTELPENYTYGVPECEGFDPNFLHGHTASADGTGSGVFGALARGAARVGQFLLPEPLVARRLHGGLNTTVYDTRGDASEGEGENAPAFQTEPAPEIAEFGAIFDVDALNSEATVPQTGQVGFATEIEIRAQDVKGLPFPFQVPVTVTVVSGADEIEGVVSYIGDGVYEATYTPTTVGTDVITITIDGDAMASPFESLIAPRNVDPSGSTVEISYSEVGGETTVTVTVRDTEGDPYTYGQDYPINVAIEVTGANTASVQAQDDDGNGNYDGVYEASYTPTSYGDDEIAVTVNGAPVGDSPYTITTAPRPADPSQSTATLESTSELFEAQVDEETTLTITVLNTAGEPYDYADVRPILVEFSVTGANTVGATTLSDPEKDGVYITSYTPANDGPDYLKVTIDGTDISGSPYTSEVAPRTGDLIVDLNITGSAPEDGLPVILYTAEGTEVATAPTGTGGIATFSDVEFGDYVVHFPKRDFDMDFVEMTRAVTHNQDPYTVTFAANTLPMPASAQIWRVRDGGNGNGYEYIVDGRSFGASLNQIAAMAPLHGAQPHMVDIFSLGENDFVTGIFLTDVNLCPGETNTKRCKFTSWIGLTDEVVEGEFRWVTTGELATWFNWPDGTTAADQPEDRKGNQDHVELGVEGTWSIINGASSTNDGYFVEWDVESPDTPPTF